MTTDVKKMYRAVLLYYVRVELILINVFKSWNFGNVPPTRDRMQRSCDSTRILRHITSTIRTQRLETKRGKLSHMAKLGKQCSDEVDE